MNEQEALNNLVTSIHLRENDDKYQLIYTTQLYGTIFSVFANFSALNEENGIMRINQINFIGVNYKGQVNLDIKAIQDPVLVDNDQQLNVTLELQSDDRGPYTSIISKSVDVAVDKELGIIVDRELLPMNANYDRVDIPIEDRAFRDGKFDSEYFLRDGVFIVPKFPEWSQIGDTDIFGQALNMPFAPSRSCVIGKGTMRTTGG